MENDLSKLSITLNKHFLPHYDPNQNGYCIGTNTKIKEFYNNSGSISQKKILKLIVAGHLHRLDKRVVRLLCAWKRTLN